MGKVLYKEVLWTLFVFISSGLAQNEIIRFRDLDCKGVDKRLNGSLVNLFLSNPKFYAFEKSGDVFSLIDHINDAFKYEDEDFDFKISSYPQDFTLKEKGSYANRYGGSWITFYDISGIGTFSLSPEFCTLLGQVECNNLTNGVYPSPSLLGNETFFQAMSKNVSISFSLWSKATINIKPNSSLCEARDLLKDSSIGLLGADGYVGVKSDKAIPRLRFTFTDQINNALSLSPLIYESIFTAVPTFIRANYSMIDIWAECERTLKITTITSPSEIIFVKHNQTDIESLIENIKTINGFFQTFFISSINELGVTKTKLRFTPRGATNLLRLSKNLACTLGFNSTDFDGIGEYYSSFEQNLTCFNNLQPDDNFKIGFSTITEDKWAISVPLENTISSIVDQVKQTLEARKRHDLYVSFDQDGRTMVVSMQDELRIQFSPCLNEAFGLHSDFVFANRSTKVTLPSLHLRSQKCHIQLTNANSSRGITDLDLNRTSNARYRRATENPPANKYSCNYLFNEVLLPISSELRIPQFIEIGMICGVEARPPIKFKPTNHFLLAMEIENDVTTVLTSDLEKFEFQPSTDPKKFFITAGSSSVCKVNIEFGNTAHVLHYKSPEDDPLKHETSKITLLLLIKVPNKQKSILQPFRVTEKSKGKVKSYICPKISTSQFETIKPMIIDALGFGYSCTTEQDTILRGIIPNFPGDCEDFLISSHYTPEERTTKLQSFSRCAGDNGNFQPKSFRESSPTPGETNKCDADVLIYPFPHKSGQVFQSSAQKIILNVWNSVQYGQSHPEFYQGEPRDVTAKIVGVSKRSISTIKKRATDTTLATPNKKRKRKCPKQLSIDSFDRMMIRDLIEDFYKNGQPPLFDDIYDGFLKKKNEDIASRQHMHDKYPDSCSRPDPFPGICKPTFAKVLKGMDFKYGRINNRAAVVLRSDITIRRARFLRRMKENRELPSPLPVVYLDETWIDPNQRLEKAWVPSKIISYKDRKTYAFPNHKIGRGPRIIVIGAASDEEGMIMSCLKTVKIQKGAVAHDYHDNVNSESFMAYFIELLDHLDSTGKKYLIVMDNASYHSSRLYPLKSAKKLEKYNWVRSKIGKPGVSLTLPEYSKVRVRHLDEMINTLKQTPSLQYELYKVDMEARKRGHEVLRLWPYGCDANPIELIWQTCKQEIRKRNINQNLDDMVEVAREVFQTVANATVWAKYVGHVRKIEDAYWRQDGILENIPESIVIPLGMDEDDEEDIFERESAYERSINEAIRAAMEGTLDRDVVVESNGDITVRISDGACEDEGQTLDTQESEYYNFIEQGGFEYESSFPMCSGPRPIRRRRLDFNPETPVPFTAGTSSESGPGVCDLEDEEDLLLV